MTSTGNPVESGVSLTVDELEEKLSTLHNYLSTPYRARAKAILQKRRQREAQALLSRSHDVRLCSSKANEGRVSSGHDSAPFNSPVSTENASSAKENASSDEKAPDEWPTRVAVASSTIPTELKSKYNSEHEVAKRGGRSEVCEPSPAACAAAQTLTLDPHTRRYVQQLEWQVKMLADALQEERERLAQIDAHVVQPLLQLGDAALRRQLQLEAALALGRSRKHDEMDPFCDEVCGERERSNLLGSSSGDILKESRDAAAS